MLIQFRCLSSLCCSLAILFASASTARPGFGLDFKHRSAASLVQEALHREVYSLQEERESLLEEAAKEQPNMPEVRWHRGHVELAGRWVRVDDVPQIMQRNDALAQYEEMRATSPKTIAGHWALATWCADNGLPDQQRAHLESVLNEAPDHAVARAVLGYRAIDGRWYGQAELEERRREQDLAQQASSRWGREIETIRNLLRDNRPQKKQSAADQLAGIEDLEVIPVLETVLSPDSGAAGALVVDWLARQSGQPATNALVRQATWSPWANVRHEAATALRGHEPSRFVPQFLALMVTPVSSQFTFTPTRAGMVYQTVFRRETNDEQQELALQREYVRRRRPRGDGRLTLMRAVFDSWTLGNNWQNAVESQNTQAAALNQRVCTALNIATCQQRTPDPQQWWQWWNNERDVVLQGTKQRRQIQRGDQVTLVDFVPQQTMQDFETSPRTRQAECFAAGTMVWTVRGRRPIERVQVGDLVLSQDVESGELRYKPVLRTTARLPEPLLRVEADDETFTVTPGHLFWVSGTAWRQARKLTSAQPLHAVGGIVSVLSVEPAAAEATYNLDVADYHTYFVGSNRILSHDVTSPQPVDTLVPGLLH